MFDEKEILQRVEDYDSMSIEAFEPYMERSTYKAARFLLDLKLLMVKENSIVITNEGKEALKQGLEFWLEDYVYNEIKENRFRKTKSTTEQERLVVRKLEAENKIYTTNQIRYYINPKNFNSSITPDPNTTTEKNRNKSWWERNIDKKDLITGLLLLLIGAIITFIMG